VRGAALAFAVCLLGQNPAYAQARWVTIYHDAAVKVLLDSTRIEQGPEGSHVVWTSWRFSKSQRLLQGSGTRGPTYRSVTGEVQLKCDPPALKYGTSIYYAASGDVVQEDVSSAADFAVEEWRRPIPDTTGEIVYRRICEMIPHILGG
jgi:hypothetical protein